jgi:hypothetical protein
MHLRSLIPVGSALTAAVVIATLQPATAHYLLKGLAGASGWLRSQRYLNHSIRFDSHFFVELTDALWNSHDSNAGAVSLNFQQALARDAFSLIPYLCSDTVLVASYSDQVRFRPRVPDVGAPLAVVGDKDGERVAWSIRGPLTRMRSAQAELSSRGRPLRRHERRRVRFVRLHVEFPFALRDPGGPQLRRVARLRRHQRANPHQSEPWVRALR